MSVISPPVSFSRTTFAAQVRAMASVFMREWWIFLRYPTWIIAMVVWPIIFPAAYILSARALAGPDGSGLAQFLRNAGTDNFLGYIAIGTTVWMWQNIVLWDVGFALRRDQQRGTLESNWVTPTWRFLFLIGQSLSQMITVIVFVGMTLLEFTLLLGMRLNVNPLSALLVVLLAIPCIYGLGFAFASLVIVAREANTFVFLVRGMVMVFCGITYPVSVMPVWMQSIAAWMPPTQIISGMRAALLTAATPTQIAPTLLTLALMGAFWLTVGILLFRWTDRRAARTGSMGQY